MKNVERKYGITKISTYRNVTRKINDLNILQKKSILICETEKNFQLKKKFSKYIKHEKHYGRIKLIFLIFN